MELLAEIEKEEQLEIIQSRKLQEQLSKGRKHAVSRPYIAEGVADLRARNQVNQQVQSGNAFYEGPNITQIRKTPGLGPIVEERIRQVRSDVPSLARRPDAGMSNQQRVNMERSRIANPVKIDPYQSRSNHSQRQQFVTDLVDLSEDPVPVLSNPRLASARVCQQTDYLTNDDPETEPSDDENDANIDGKQMKLVYRRYKY